MLPVGATGRRAGSATETCGPEATPRLPVTASRPIRLNAFDMACVGHIQHGMWILPDSPLEGTGFEPSVPLLQRALLGVANRDVGTISGTT
jgi:hypothetical protein